MTRPKYHSTSVDVEIIHNHLLELIDRCGSGRKAAEYADIGIQTVYRVKDKVYNTVQHKTATKILLALKNKRLDDRIHHSTHQKLTDKQRQFAKIERLL